MKRYLDKIQDSLKDTSKLLMFEDPDAQRSAVHLKDPRKTDASWHKYCVSNNINSPAKEAVERERIEDLVNDVTALLLYEDKLKSILHRREEMLTQVVNKAQGRDDWLIKIRR